MLMKKLCSLFFLMLAAGGCSLGDDANEPCVLHPQLIQDFGMWDYSTVQLQLVPTGEGSAQVTLVALDTPPGGPSIPNEIWLTTFDPWNGWPDDGKPFGHHHFFDSHLGNSMRVGPDFGRLSALFPTTSEWLPAPGLVFMPSVKPIAPFLEESIWLADFDARPGFVDGRNGDAHLVGWAENGAWADVVKVALVKETAQGLHLESTMALGCASETTRQAVAYAEPAWITAFSSGVPFAADTCVSGLGAVGPPDRLVVARTEVPSLDFSSSLELPISGRLETLSVVPNGDRVFVVWTTTNRAEIAQVDLGVTTLLGPTRALAQHVVGAAPFAGGVVLVEQHEAKSSSLVLRMFDGLKFSEPLGALDLEGTVISPIAVLTHPGYPDTVIVAWSEQSDELRVKVARFDCEL